MFHQVVGDGASLFITIVAILVGFVAGLSYTDKMKVDREQEHQDGH
jgi:hypothetical protein